MNILQSLKDKLLLHKETICNIWNGTMFVDLDWPLNASSLLSASAELLVTRAARRSKRGIMLRRRGWVAGWLAGSQSHAGIVSKRLNLS